jgi:hypothetical protein
MEEGVPLITEDEKLESKAKSLVEVKKVRGLTG